MKPTHLLKAVFTQHVPTRLTASLLAVAGLHSATVNAQTNLYTAPNGSLSTVTTGNGVVPVLIQSIPGGTDAYMDQALYRHFDTNTGQWLSTGIMTCSGSSCNGNSGSVTFNAAGGIISGGATPNSNTGLYPFSGTTPTMTSVGTVYTPSQLNALIASSVAASQPNIAAPLPVIGNGAVDNTQAAQGTGNQVAYGTNAVVNAAGGSALGSNAVVAAGASNSTALGQGSLATRPNEVSVGNVNTGATSVISNVSAGTLGTDAVNVTQLNTGLGNTLSSANSYTNQQVAAGVASAVTQSNTYTNQVAATTLASANTYTDRVAATTLTSANTYTDQQVAAGVVSAVTQSNAYTNQVAATTLASANTYTNQVAATTLTSANTYTDQVAATTLSSANTYTNQVAATTLASANTYTDRVAATTLTSANTYTDQVAATTLSSANTYTNQQVAAGVVSAVTHSNTYTDGRIGNIGSGTVQNYVDQSVAAGVQQSNRYTDTAVAGASAMANKGTAAAMAMGTTKVAQHAGKFSAGAGLASYGGEQAVSITGNYLSQSGRGNVSVGLAKSSGKSPIGFQAGVSWTLD